MVEVGVLILAGCSQVAERAIKIFVDDYFEVSPSEYR